MTDVRVDWLAQRLLADRNVRPPATRSAECFACGRSSVAKPRAGDDNPRFCSAKCRQAYDDGFTPATDPDPSTITQWRVIAGPHPGFMPSMSMIRTGGGFRISCKACGKAFESHGLAFCSVVCEHDQRERNARRSVMAEVDMEPIREKRRCQRPGCPNHIPLWRKGRRVSSRAQFCDLHTK